MSEIGKQIGQRIRSLRTERGVRWTQEALAERARISVSFLSMIERGERVPHVETLAALANALGVSLVEIFDLGEADGESTEDVVRPLVEFTHRAGLKAADVQRLLGVARAMFAPGPDRGA